MMIRIDHNQTWDRAGNLISEEFVEVPDNPADPLTAEVEKLKSTLEEIGKAADFAAAKDVINARKSAEGDQKERSGT